ncbi:MAG: hypothetical protein B6D39_01660 [Anaerolineae bacterium UTCFX2]|nr:RNA methyltransferase [Anaerolineae bacterium]MCZ7552668.1 RNA methyltransferase [Anaerolineales bacterium]OQY94211.1 MAG: hypothetical protein B6D39_01660 [Anaerolineae bacterium UTCFX2]
MITSYQNPRIKWLKALQNQPRLRRAEKTFVVEGVRLVEEALAAGWKARFIIHTQDLSERGQKVLQGFAVQGAPIEQVTESVLHSASATVSSSELLAALEWLDLPLPSKPDFVLIADQIRDPGNLGAMLRTALAAGVQAALLPPETTDAFAPKTLRAGMGAHFRLPIRSLAWEAITQYLKDVPLLLAATDEGAPYTQTDLQAPFALIVGNEAQGASPAARQAAGGCLHIPLPGKSESLNAAVAAGVLMFEAVRQRQLSRLPVSK